MGRCSPLPFSAVVILFASSSASNGAAKSPIKIGVLSDCEGVWAAFYNYTLAGTELPLIQQGAVENGAAPSAGLGRAEIAGRPVQLSFGCADGPPRQCSGKVDDSSNHSAFES